MSTPVPTGTVGAVTVIGEGNRVEGNNISYADRGLYITSAGNAVLRNSLKSGTVSLEIAPGNDVGPIGSVSHTTSAGANIQHCSNGVEGAALVDRAALPSSYVPARRTCEQADCRGA